MSEGVGPHLAGADPHDLLDPHHPNLPVADLARPRGLRHRVNHALDLIVVAEHLELHLRHEVHLVLGAAVDLGVTALTAEPLDLGGGKTVHADVAERLLYLIEPVGLHDRDDELHPVPPVPPPSPTSLAPSHRFSKTSQARCPSPGPASCARRSGPARSRPARGVRGRPRPSRAPSCARRAPTARAGARAPPPP